MLVPPPSPLFPPDRTRSPSVFESLANVRLESNESRLYFARRCGWICVSACLNDRANRNGRFESMAKRTTRGKSNGFDFFFLRKGEVWRGLIRNVLITSKFYVYVFLDKRTVRTVSGANCTHKYTRSNTIISNLTLYYLCYTKEIHLQHDYFPINVHTTSHYAGG